MRGVMARVSELGGAAAGGRAAGRAVVQRSRGGAAGARVTSAEAPERTARLVLVTDDGTVSDRESVSRPVHGWATRALRQVLAWCVGLVTAVATRAAGRAGRDAGMTTAEYAVGTIAACAFAAVLFKVVTSGAVLSLLQSVVTKALHAL